MKTAAQILKEVQDWATESASLARREFNRECCDKMKKGVHSGKIQAFESCAEMLGEYLKELQS